MMTWMRRRWIWIKKIYWMNTQKNCTRYRYYICYSMFCLSICSVVFATIDSYYHTFSYFLYNNGIITEIQAKKNLQICIPNNNTITNNHMIICFLQICNFFFGYASVKRVNNYRMSIWWHILSPISKYRHEWSFLSTLIIQKLFRLYSNKRHHSLWWQSLYGRNNR